MTVTEYMKQTPEGCGELINGVFMEPPAPDYVHQSSSLSLVRKIADYVEKFSGGIVLTAPMDVVLDKKLVVQPDILYISKERKNIIAKYVNGAPDLVIEIVSKGNIRHDTVKKKKIYARYGIQEYWIVYPDEKVIEVFILRNNAYILFQTAEQSNKVSSLILKGFSVAVNKIFNF